MVLRFDRVPRHRPPGRADVRRRWRRPRSAGDADGFYRSGDHYVPHCDLAGVDPGSIDLNVDGSVLTIRAERSPRTDEEVQWLSRERPFGTFQRQLSLGDGVDVDNIAATYNDGVLTVTIPVAERARPRRIQLSTTGSTEGRVLEGTATEADATPRA